MYLMRWWCNVGGCKLLVNIVEFGCGDGFMCSTSLNLDLNLDLENLQLGVINSYYSQLEERFIFSQEIKIEKKTMSWW